MFAVNGSQYSGAFTAIAKHHKPFLPFGLLFNQYASISNMTSNITLQRLQYEIKHCITLQGLVQNIVFVTDEC